VLQLPLALYALRLAPHASTGMSPFCYVHGNDMSSPIKLLYHGWREEGARELYVSRRTQHLAERLDLMRDAATS